MHLGIIPPGGVSAAHKHDGHETVLYVLSGRAAMEYGEQLEQRVEGLQAKLEAKIAELHAWIAQAATTAALVFAVVKLAH